MMIMFKAIGNLKVPPPHYQHCFHLCNVCTCVFVDVFFYISGEKQIRWVVYSFFKEGYAT